MKIHLMLFKNLKHVFELPYQTSLNNHISSFPKQIRVIYGSHVKIYFFHIKKKVFVLTLLSFAEVLACHNIIIKKNCYIFGIIIRYS